MDVYTDSGAHLKERFGDELPEFIKNAAFIGDRSALTDDNFARVSRDVREFPTVDKGNTAVSVIYFMDHHDDIPQAELQKVAERLVSACGRYELAAPVELVKLAKHGPTQESEQPSTTEESVKQAMRHFLDKEAEYEPRHRRDLCIAFVKQAAALGVDDVPDVIRIYASNSKNPDFAKHMDVRRGLLKSAGFTPYLEVIDELEKVANVDLVANTLYELDKEAGLDRLYDTRIADPYTATCGYPAPAIDMDATMENIVKFASSEEAQAIFDPQMLEAVVISPIDALESLPGRLQDLFVEECNKFYEKA
jgi:hypothetical protein